MTDLIKYIVSNQVSLGFVAAGLGAISFLPQVIKIWHCRSVKDISAAMYILYAISLVLWLVYGIIIKSDPLVIAELFSLVLVSIILIMKYLWK